MVQKIHLFRTEHLICTGLLELVELGDWNTRAAFMTFPVIFFTLGAVLKWYWASTIGDPLYRTFSDDIFSLMGFDITWGIVLTAASGTVIVLVVSSLRYGISFSGPVRFLRNKFAKFVRRVSRVSSSKDHNEAPIPEDNGSYSFTPTSGSFGGQLVTGVFFVLLMGTTICSLRSKFLDDIVALLFGEQAYFIAQNGFIYLLPVFVSTLLLAIFWRKYRMEEELTSAGLPYIFLGVVFIFSLMTYLAIFQVITNFEWGITQLTNYPKMVLDATAVLTINWCACICVWSSLGLPRQISPRMLGTLSMEEDLPKSYRDSLFSLFSLTGRHRFNSGFLFSAGVVVSTGAVGFEILWRLSQEILSVDVISTYLRALFLVSSTLTATSILLTFLAVYFMLRGTNSVFGVAVLVHNHLREITTLTFAFVTKIFFLALLLLFQEDEVIRSLVVKPSVLLVIDLGISIPFYGIVYSAFEMSEEMDNYLGKLTLNNLISSTYSYLVLGGGSIAKQFAIHIIREGLYEALPLARRRAIDYGYRIVGCNQVGISLRRIPPAQQRRDISTYLLEGMVFIDDNEEEVSFVGTHPQLGKYGVTEILLSDQERMLLLVPTIVESIQNRSVVRRAVRYARVIVHTSPELAIVFPMMKELRNIWSKRASSKGTYPWPVVIAITDSSRVYRVVHSINFEKMNDSGTEVATGTYHAIPLYLERTMSSFVGSLALVGWTESKKPENMKILIIGGSTRRAFYLFETIAAQKFNCVLNKSNIFMIRSRDIRLLSPNRDHICDPSISSGYVTFHFRDSLGAEKSRYSHKEKRMCVYRGTPNIALYKQIFSKLKAIVISGDEFHTLGILNWLIVAIEHFKRKTKSPLRLVILAEEEAEANECRKLLAEFMRRKKTKTNIIPYVFIRPAMAASFVSAFAFHGKLVVHDELPERLRLESHSGSEDKKDTALTGRLHCPIARDFESGKDVCNVRVQRNYVVESFSVTKTHGVSYGCCDQDIGALLAMLHDVLSGRGEPDKPQEQKETEGARAEKPGSSVVTTGESYAYISVCLKDVPGALVYVLNSLAGCVSREASSDDFYETSFGRSILNISINPCNKDIPRSMIQFAWESLDSRPELGPMVERVVLVTGGSDESRDSPWYHFMTRLKDHLRSGNAERWSLLMRSQGQVQVITMGLERSKETTDRDRATPVCKNMSLRSFCPVAGALDLSHSLGDANGVEPGKDFADTARLDIISLSTSGYCFCLPPSRESLSSTHDSCLGSGNSLRHAWVHLVARLSGYKFQSSK